MMRYGNSDDATSYLTDRDQWLPVIVKTSSADIIDKDKSGIFNVSIDVELAQDIKC